MITEFHFEIKIKGDNPIGVQINKSNYLFLDQFQLILECCQSYYLPVERVKRLYEVEGNNSIELTRS